MRIADNIENEFNAFSSDYTQDMIKCVPHYLELIDAFTKDLPKGYEPKHILDLGCGNGNVSTSLMRLFPYSNYILLDASQQMLDLCRLQFKVYDVDYIKSYFHEYPFKKDQFDMIVAGFSLHHCNELEKKSLFKSIFSSLKQGGVFGYSDLMVNKDHADHLRLLKDWKAFVADNYSNDEKWIWLMEHYDEFDKPNDFKLQNEWLKQVGFNDINCVIQEDYWVHIRAQKN